MSFDFMFYAYVYQNDNCKTYAKYNVEKESKIS